MGEIEKSLRRLVIRLGLKGLAKKCLAINEQVAALFNRFAFRSQIKTIQNFAVFAPSVSGSHKIVAELTVLSANQTFPFLVSFIEKVKFKHFGEPIPIKSLADSVEIETGAKELEALFYKFGTDKAEHEYHYLYASILRNRDLPLNVLEIGLGTPHTDIASHMGRGAKCGASLRAFREFLPRANIYGADIDSRILFQENRISTVFVDQTVPESFDNISKHSGHCSFDLIIDDGLHAPNANIASLIFACKNLSAGGWFVVEDINWSALPLWQVVADLLPTNFEWLLIAARYWLLFAIRKRN